MKKWLFVIYIWIPFITAVFAFFVVEMAREKQMSFSSFIKYMKETSSGNILYNGDFKKGVKFWNTLTPENIFPIIDDRIQCAQIINVTNNWSDLFQTVQLKNAHTYSLSFKVKTDSPKTLVLYREDKINNEDYIFCKSNNEWHSYSKTIQPFSNYVGRIVLSLRNKGKALFSDISIKDNDSCIKQKFQYLILSYLFIISVVLLLSYFQYYNLTTVIIILLCIIAPIFRIGKDEVSNFESRKLNKYKPVWLEGKFNLTYGLDFNNWLNDHFCGRTLIIQANTILKSFINNKIDNNTVFAGKDRWYFRKNNLSLLANYKEDEPKNYSKTLASLNRFSEYCKKHNSDLYILVAPCNEELYDENLSGIILGKRKYAIGNTIEKLKNDTGINLIYCRDVLESNKPNGLVSYKTDHHWTDLGAFKSYQRILNEISLTHPSIKPLPENDFKIDNRSFDWDIGFGTQFNALNIPKNLQPKYYPDNGAYKIYNYKNQKLIKTEENVTINPNGIDKKVLLFGDSMTIYIQKFFFATFNKTLIYREYGEMHMKQVEQLINSFKPDIVIMIIYYSNFNVIKNWY